MSHQNTEHSRAVGLNILSGRFGTTRKVLDADYVVDLDGPLAHFLDPDGSDRTVTMPPMGEGGGLFYIIANTSEANNLVVQSANGLEIDHVLPRQFMMFVSSESEWISTAGLAKAAGADNRAGQVPSPGPVEAAVRFLREDMQWASVFVSGVVDAFKFITDGTTTAEGTGPDTFKIRSSDDSVSVAVQNNDATHGDNVDLQVNESNVDHNALGNYVADEHIAHTLVELTAGLGLSGGGDISASRAFALDFTSLSVVTPDLVNDFVVFHDTSLGLPSAATFATLNGILEHDDLSGFVAAEHVDHTLIGIVAGLGLSGGGDLTNSRSLSLDFTSLDAGAGITAADYIPFYDVTAGEHFTLTFGLLNTILNHDDLAGFVSNEHINHSSVSVIAGSGLTGGGSITSSRTLNVGAGEGISVSADVVNVSISGLTEETVVDTASDEVMVHDASVGALRRVKLTNLLGTGLDIVGLTGETSIEDDDEIPFYDVSATDNKKITKANLITSLRPGLGVGLKSEFFAPIIMAPRATQPSGNTVATDLGTTDSTLYTKAFGATLTEFAMWHWVPPNNWDHGDLYARVYWSGPTGTVGQGVVWRLDAEAIGDGGGLNVTPTAGIVINDTLLNAGNVLHVTDFSGPFSAGGTPTDDSMLMFTIGRYPGAAADTLAVSAILLGVRLFYSTDDVVEG